MIKKGIITKLRNSFIAGLVVILPIVVTLWFLKLFIAFLNAALLEPITRNFEQFLPSPIYEFFAKVAVFLTAVILLIFVGISAGNIIIRKIFGFGEKFLFKFPLTNKLYPAVKDITKALLGQQTALFKKVVVVEFPRSGLYSVGFVTGHINQRAQEKIPADLYNVFIPTAPNPTSGFLLLVPEEQLTELDISVEDALKLVISAGAAVPEKYS